MSILCRYIMLYRFVESYIVQDYANLFWDISLLHTFCQGILCKTLTRLRAFVILKRLTEMSQLNG